MVLAIDPAQRQQLCGIYMLQLLVEETGEVLVPLEREQAFLAPVMEWLHSCDYVQVHDRAYHPTQKGRDVLGHFLQRYQHFLAEMDVYCAVDLAEGEFAFSSYDTFPTQPAWESFLAQERWADVRVALCEWKGKDPIEAVFMNFVEEGTFGLSRNGWDYDSFLGQVWEDIAAIAHGAIRLQDLAYEDQGEFFPASKVAQDIYEQGQQIR
jgi:hypothetical protein